MACKSKLPQAVLLILRAKKITKSSTPAAASSSGAPLLSPKPLCGRAVAAVAGVTDPGVEVRVCARAAWVNKAATVCVAGPRVRVNVLVNSAVIGVMVAVGGRGVNVRVAVRLGVSVGVLVTCKAWATAVPVSSAEEGPEGAACRGKITRAYKAMAISPTSKTAPMRPSKARKLRLPEGLGGLGAGSCGRSRSLSSNMLGGTLPQKVQVRQRDMQVASATELYVSSHNM